jgi:hypothetical protein
MPFDVTNRAFDFKYGDYAISFLLYLFTLYILVVFSFNLQANCFHTLSLGVCTESYLLQSGFLISLLLCLLLIYTLRTMCSLSLGVWRHFSDFVHNFRFNMYIFLCYSLEYG